MKTLAVLILLSPMFVHAKAKVHSSEFNNVAVGEGAQYWARIYDWSGWEKTKKQKNLKLASNYVKQAYDLKQKPYRGVDLKTSDFTSVLGRNEGLALEDFYISREEVEDPQDISARGAVFESKVQLDLPDSYDIKKLTLQKVVDIMAKADRPHIHKKVTHKFAHNFIDSLHGGHAELKKHSKGIPVLTVINTGENTYKCSKLNFALNLQGEMSGVSGYDDDFRVHLLNIFDEIKDVSSLSTVIEGKPERVFVQKIIYSSNLIKSGSNYVSFYTNSSGKKKIILTSVIVTTDKVLNSLALKTYLNGIQFSNILKKVTYKKGKPVSLNSSNLDVRQSKGKGSCEKGLGLGVASYIYNLALNLVGH